MAGFGAGWGLKPSKAADELEAQNRQLDIMGDQLADIASSAGRPVVIDAELRATLAEVPVQCVESSGGDPFSPPCAWATCLQYGQSSARRPECREIEAVMIGFLEDSDPGPGCPECPPCETVEP